MSAKNEKELRRGIKICEELMKRQDENEKQILRLTKLTQDGKNRIEKLEEWRMDHILQDMVRRDREKQEKELRVQLALEKQVHIRRIRKAFGWASGVCYLLLLGLTGGLECGTIPFWLAVPLMIFTACGGFVFACKAGLMVWE